MKKYLLMWAVLLLVGAVGFLLPSMLLKWEDEKLIGQNETEESEAVTLTIENQLSLNEKIQMIWEENVATALESGKNYTYSTIEEKIREEVHLLNEYEILCINEEAMHYDDKSALLLVSNDGVQFFTVWQIFGYSEEIGVLRFDVDDETGKILGVHSMSVYTDATSSIGDDIAISVDLENSMGRWSDYLGCELSAEEMKMMLF